MIKLSRVQVGRASGLSPSLGVNMLRQTFIKRSRSRNDYY